MSTNDTMLRKRKRRDSIRKIRKKEAILNRKERTRSETRNKEPIKHNPNPKPDPVPDRKTMKTKDLLRDIRKGERMKEPFSVTDDQHLFWCVCKGKSESKKKKSTVVWS